MTPTVERIEDEAVLYALGLHDAGFSFDQIGKQLGRDEDWARQVCTDVFTEEAAAAPRLN